MLTNLHVKNLALIDEAEVEFGPGLNILTGETGAGKSILIGSINAALAKQLQQLQQMPAMQHAERQDITRYELLDGALRSEGYAAWQVLSLV